MKVEAQRIWATAVASAGQVRNWLDVTEVRGLKRSIEDRTRLMSRWKGGECRTARHELQCCAARHGLGYRTARYGLLYRTAWYWLLKVVPHTNAVMVRACSRLWLLHSHRGNAPTHHTVGTSRVVEAYRGGAFAAVGEVVFPSCSES